MQIEDRRNKDNFVKQIEKGYYDEIKFGYQEFLKDKADIEHLKKNKCQKYKDELDKQISDSKKWQKPLMNDTEKQINKNKLFV